MENGISESTSVIRAVAPGCPTSAVPPSAQAHLPPGQPRPGLSRSFSPEWSRTGGYDSRAGCRHLSVGQGTLLSYLFYVPQESIDSDYVPSTTEDKYAVDSSQPAGEDRSTLGEDP